MDNVIKTLYWCDVANKFSYLSGSIAFIFSVICIGTLAFIMLMYFCYDEKTDGKRPQELILPAKIILATSFFSFVSVAIGTYFMPSQLAQKKNYRSENRNCSEQHQSCLNRTHISAKIIRTIERRHTQR